MLYSLLHRIKLSHWLGKRILTDRFIPFRLFYRLLALFRFDVSVRRNGKKMKIPIRNGVGYMNLLPDYEKWLDLQLKRLIQENEPTILDIGANVGQTLLKAKSLFPACSYHAVEPNPCCIDYLEHLCQTNQFVGVYLHALALSNEAGNVPLQIRFKDDILATTTPTFRIYTRYDRTIQVPTTTGDELIQGQNIARIDLIKIDVEGGENKVLAGLRKSIGRFRPLILCEILPLHSKSEEVTSFRTKGARQIFTLCKEFNYEIINLASSRKVDKTSQLSSSLEESNYLLIPMENSPAP